MKCQHRRFTYATETGEGNCIDCGADGRMRFVVGDPAAEERARCLWIANRAAKNAAYGHEKFSLGLVAAQIREGVTPEDEL
jgi:hypothetical protein